MPNLTRKYKLIPVGDKEEVNRVYTYLRKGMENQNKAMNQYITALYVAQMLQLWSVHIWAGTSIFVQ